VLMCWCDEMRMDEMAGDETREREGLTRACRVGNSQSAKPKRE
jgi:hypothetical protein